MLSSVEYLGYHISGEGISPTKEKRRAIVDAPVPEDISQLKSFWNYYARFLLVLQTHWHHCTSCSPNTNHGVAEQIRQLHSRRLSPRCFAGLL